MATLSDLVRKRAISAQIAGGGAHDDYEDSILLEVACG
jgi:hypothetical protein